MRLVCRQGDSLPISNTPPTVDPLDRQGSDRPMQTPEIKSRQTSASGRANKVQPRLEYAGSSLNTAGSVMRVDQRRPCLGGLRGNATNGNFR
jgi:hypothetical protein